MYRFTFTENSFDCSLIKKNKTKQTKTTLTESPFSFIQSCPSVLAWKWVSHNFTTDLQIPASLKAHHPLPSSLVIFICKVEKSHFFFSRVYYKENGLQSSVNQNWNFNFSTYLWNLGKLLFMKYCISVAPVSRVMVLPFEKIQRQHFWKLHDLPLITKVYQSTSYILFLWFYVRNWLRVYTSLMNTSHRLLLAADLDNLLNFFVTPFSHL